ncbi:MAG: HEAT repeat domain-containing protein [Planctomycetes bacterium]|nr:HEAT repeat domain-containing protein [Planctomycetota bacterium]
MEEATLDELERLAERDPADREALERLDAACRARGWTLYERRLEDWIDDLRRLDRRRWGADNPENILGGAGPRAVSRLIEAFWNDAGVRPAAARILGRSGEGTAAYLELVRGLRSSDPSIRTAAAHGLAKCDSEAAVPVLIQLLGDPDSGVRIAAVHALDDLGPKALAAVPSLLRCLGDDELGLSAAFALGYLGRENPAIVLDLIEEAESRLPGADPWALLGLGLTRSRTALPALLDALRHYDEEVRREAVEALGELGIADGSVLDSLRDSLHDWDLSVRAEAAVALAGLGDHSPRVCAALAQAIGEDGCRPSVIRTLEKLGPRAEAVLPAILIATRERDDSERADALSALAAIGPQNRVLPVILEALEDSSPRVRAGAARALARFTRPPEPAIGALVRALDDPDRQVESCAASTLFFLKPRDLTTRRALIKRTSSTDEGMRVIAVDILGAIGADLDALLAAAEDKSESVRFSALYRLAEIREKSDRSVRGLSRALDDRSARVRREGAWGLGELGTVSAPAKDLLLEALLGDEDNSVREHAAYALGEIGSPSQDVVEGLLGALGDARRNVSIMAARSLWILGAEREAAHARILESLRGEDDLRGFALRVVRDHGVPAE